MAKLGDDAENTAWEIFLEFIHAYQGNKYRLLPGLVQMHLHYALLHEVYPETMISVDYELSLDIPHTLSQNTAVTDSLEAEICNQAYVSFLLNQLTEKQKDIVIATIINKQTLEEYRLEHKISFKVAYTRQKAALQKLKKYLFSDILN